MMKLVGRDGLFGRIDIWGVDVYDSVVYGVAFCFWI